VSYPNRERHVHAIVVASGSSWYGYLLSGAIELPVRIVLAFICRSYAGDSIPPRVVIIGGNARYVRQPTYCAIGHAVLIPTPPAWEADPATPR
jgi:hypothetical protein